MRTTRSSSVAPPVAPRRSTRNRAAKSSSPSKPRRARKNPYKKKSLSAGRRPKNPYRNQQGSGRSAGYTFPALQPNGSLHYPVAPDSPGRPSFTQPVLGKRKDPDFGYVGGAQITWEHTRKKVRTSHIQDIDYDALFEDFELPLKKGQSSSDEPLSISIEREKKIIKMKKKLKKWY